MPVALDGGGVGGAGVVIVGAGGAVGDAVGAALMEPPGVVGTVGDNGPCAWSADETSVNAIKPPIDIARIPRDYTRPERVTMASQ